MLKVVAILSRKAGLTFDQFRTHYETSHAVLAQQYFGHLFVEYRRNYLPSAPSISGGDPTARGEAGGPDVITEICFHNEAAYDEFLHLFSDPKTIKLFQDDEEKFLDRANSRWGVAEVVTSRL